MTEEDVEANKTVSEQQIIKSAEELEKLILEGDEFITNISIANDAREVEHRHYSKEYRASLMQKLDEEATSAQEMYNQINDRWSELMLYHDPLDINESIIQQKARCSELVAQKDALIQVLREEVDKAEIKFEKDQVEQKADVDLLASRIHKQLDLMKRAYRDELRLIEYAVETERQKLIEESSETWKGLVKQRNELEEQNMMKKIQQQDEFLFDLHSNRIKNEELYRETKIALENENQVLQQELEHLKAFCLLNGEKLDYNYQVLKKREDENLIIRSQQKRLINKLRDELNAIRYKTREYKSECGVRFERLTKEIHSLRNSVFQVEAKAELLKQTNDTKFLQVWSHNEEVAIKLIEEILTTDRIIQEQLLGSEWHYPQWHRLQQKDLGSYRHAIQMLSGEKSRPSSPNLEKKKSEMEDVADIPNSLRKAVIHAIGDRAGFLLEQQMADIIKKLEKDQGTIISVETVFEALGIETEEDMNFLGECFLPYVRCPVCELQERQKLEDGSLKTTTIIPSGSNLSEVQKFDDTDTITSLMNLLDVQQPSQIIDDILDNESGETVLTSPVISSLTIELTRPSIDAQTTSTISKQSRQPVFRAQPQHRFIPGHPVVIEAAYVIKVMREFINKYNKQRSQEITIPERLARKSATVSRLLTNEDMQLFWNQFINVFPQERQNLWDGLIHGLQRYHRVLEDRHGINKEVQCLRASNAELKHLLMTATPMNKRKRADTSCTFVQSKESHDINCPARKL